MTGVNFVEFESRTVNPNLPNVSDVSSTEVRAKNDQIVIVDVRRPDEWVGEYGHIAEAQLIVLDELPMKIDSLPKNKTIVFVCRSGARSAQAAELALESGFISVYNMKGGMIDWTQNNFATVERNGD